MLLIAKKKKKQPSEREYLVTAQMVLTAIHIRATRMMIQKEEEAKKQAICLAALGY